MDPTGWKIVVEEGRSWFGQKYMVYMVAANNEDLMWTEKLKDRTYAVEFANTVGQVTGLPVEDRTATT